MQMSQLRIEDDPLTVIQRDFVGMYSGNLALSSIPGGQAAADAALATLDIAGYAAKRSEVLPREARGASVLSPYIRHNLLTLGAVWQRVRQAPARDREKYQDELLWQEYARHLYARIGVRLFQNLRFDAPWDLPGDGWETGMACLDEVASELEQDGWLVNQTRMWLASHWSVRQGRGWLHGQERMHRELIDGSRAANLLGWQWTVGAGTGKPYGFARWQVEKRAPGLCQRCPLSNRCPIQDFPDTDTPRALAPEPLLQSDPDVESTAGPKTPVHFGTPEKVLLTIDSLGDDDPALSAHPDLPAVFVFNAPALAKLQLSAKRIGFYLQTLHDLAARREVEVLLGDPYEYAAENKVAVTFAPVPSFRKFRNLVEIHPYPWLRSPHSGPVQSFSAWRKRLPSPSA
ncbi:deoxyribodipyrimidine photo-lyase [Pontimonas salivibrio]|uniref:Deoxyribodipyrimidine photo-lyase n=1 Tax=Pontimonas salivibrio TaxID=1159327 RepID=A0A2L2BQ84_9MICO|nr:FAD-binding domain-containing protein [Pontimonas salivibrio]AVG23826.1 deoxyribodipyrimidine photo-lyase [Pontimonas salivibrio]